MTPEQIKENAPEGSTYYDDVHGRMIRYVMFKHGQAYYYDSWLKQWFCYNMPCKLKPL